jgi:hypothetical protein
VFTLLELVDCALIAAGAPRRTTVRRTVNQTQDEREHERLWRAIYDLQETDNPPALNLQAAPGCNYERKLKTTDSSIGAYTSQLLNNLILIFI